jgi:hypothetical protein
MAMAQVRVPSTVLLDPLFAPLSLFSVSSPPSVSLYLSVTLSVTLCLSFCLSLTLSLSLSLSVSGVHVVTFISNCKKSGGANRLKFIQELMSYIPVSPPLPPSFSFEIDLPLFVGQIHSYGGCLNNRKEQEIPHDPRWPQHDQRRAR